MKRWLIGIAAGLVLTIAGAVVFLRLTALSGGEVAVADPAAFDPETGFVTLTDISELQARVTIETDVAVMTRDGIRLSAKVFRPAQDGRYPVVMAFTAYNKDGGTAGYPPVLDMNRKPDFDLGRFSISPWTAWEAPDPAFWLANGYAVVYVDTRGYGVSEGDAHVLSIRDRDDFFDAIEWAGRQPWSNGNVGLSGVSYLAISQWVAASGNPPSLKAIIPWEGQSDNFREVLFHGGIPETAFTAFWFRRISTLAHDSPLPHPVIFRFGQRHPLLMRRIQARMVPPSGISLPDIRVPALIAATWSDQGLHSRGSFEGYKQIGSSQKWLFTHGRQKWRAYYSPAALATQLAFFDHFLKGLENGFDRRPAVRLETRESLEEYSVRYADDWPIPGTDYRKLYLDAASGVLRRTISESAGSIEYDPATGMASFVHRFEKDTELTGNMKLRLWVSTDSGTDMDLFVGIEKLDADGETVHFYAKTGYTRGPVAMGWLRVSHRELDPVRSTPWQPVLAHERALKLSRNEIVPVDIEVLPSSTLFRAGESLRVVVQGRDLFDHPMLAHARSVNEGRHAIHTGGQYDSHLLVPVIP